MNKSGKTYEQKCFYFAPLRSASLAVSLAHRYTAYVIYLMLIFVHDSAEEAFFRKQLDANGIVCSSDTEDWKNAIKLSAVCRLSGQRTIDKLKNYFSY